MHGGCNLLSRPCEKNVGAKVIAYGEQSWRAIGFQTVKKGTNWIGT